MPRRLGALGALLIAALMVGGCTSDGPAEGAPEPARTSGSNGGQGSTDPGGDGADGDKGGGGFLSWVPFGPKDPQSPTPTWSAYNYLADGKCSRLSGEVADLTTEQGGDFGKAMAALCQAAISGRTSQWAVVEANQDAETGALEHGCLTPLVKDLMTRAVAWHRANPDTKPQIQFRRVTTGTGETDCGRAANEENRERTTEPTEEPTEQPTNGTDPETPPTDAPAPTPSPEASPERTE